MRVKFFGFFILLLCALQSYAFSWHDLWKNANQRGQELLKKADYKQAQQTFTDPSWQAVAAYRAGNYQLAADILSKTVTPHAEYNLGNALTKLGKYQAALRAYEQALAKNHADQDAKYNHDLVKKILEQQEQKQSAQSESTKDPQQNRQQNRKQGDKSAANSKQEPNQQPQKNDKSSAQEKNADKNAPQHKSTPQNDQAKSQAAEVDKKSGGARQQMKEQWLKLIPDDPGGLLREKFKRDYLRRRGEG